MVTIIVLSQFFSNVHGFLRIVYFLLWVPPFGLNLLFLMSHKPVQHQAVISEASDDTNQALGMTIVGTAWGIGYIVGPAMSL